jgi:hypothetical protein
MLDLLLVVGVFGLMLLEIMFGVLDLLLLVETGILRFITGCFWGLGAFFLSRNVGVYFPMSGIGLWGGRSIGNNTLVA